GSRCLEPRRHGPQRRRRGRGGRRCGSGSPSPFREWSRRRNPRPERQLLLDRHKRGSARMLRLSAAVLLVARNWPVALAQDKADATAQELARLEGDWQVVGLEVGTKAVRYAAGDGGTFTFPKAASARHCPGSARRRARG